eukprot:TRINITY_DN8236_c0_g1_i1.p1 TRINITY_DN8236_c0_g1~~TRINITY_DN8236_c0_g1_i1.p1  ORF type:complete len:202 (+),score=51.07 TRINITY_DN8236_c0_g1_i1:89-694(+)
MLRSLVGSEMCIRDSMFKKIEDLGNITLTNKTFAKNVRKRVEETYPVLSANLEDIIPKKGNFKTCKVRPENKVELFLNEQDEILFIITKDHVIPTLRLLHQYPTMLPSMQVDRGAIKHVLGGANIMCPGLTSAGGKMDDVPAQTVVAIRAEGKENIMAIGVTTMSSQEIKKTNKGIGLENSHYLNDDLWRITDVKAYKNKN